jgi:CRISPR-associated endoribonuclease Cas6
MDHKNQALRVGAVGRVAYAILQDDYLLTANLLADFALYAGVGVQTAAGMGQCRRLATR